MTELTRALRQKTASVTRAEPPIRPAAGGAFPAVAAAH